MYQSSVRMKVHFQFSEYRPNCCHTNILVINTICSADWKNACLWRLYDRTLSRQNTLFACCTIIYLFFFCIVLNWNETLCLRLIPQYLKEVSKWDRSFLKRQKRMHDAVPSWPDKHHVVVNIASHKERQLCLCSLDWANLYFINDYATTFH